MVIAVILADHVSLDESNPIIFEIVYGNGHGAVGVREGAVEVVVNKDTLEEAAADVLFDRGDVVRKVKAIGLAGLGGDVAYVGLNGGRCGEGAPVVLR